MSLSFLYKANADLSFQMAGAAKTPEMRKQWTDLAVHWLKKAEMGDQFSELGTKHLDDGPTISPGVLAPAVPPLVEMDTREFKRGRTLVTADAGTKADWARGVLIQHGGEVKVPQDAHA